MRSWLAAIALSVIAQFAPREINVPLCAAQAVAPHPTSRAVDATRVNASDVTHLYGVKATRLVGPVSKENGDFMKWQGRGSLTWSIEVSKAGEYEIDMCYAAPSSAGGTGLKISSGKSTVKLDLKPTSGPFGVPYLDYERVRLGARLKLDAGANELSLAVDEPKVEPAMHFRSLELVPVAAEDAVVAERERARLERASTDWMANAGYGLMFHWTSQSVSPDGTIKPFGQAVRDFDVNAFAEMVESTGAAYVLFTIGHAEPYCPAPIKSWEKHHPGKTTERDLVAELADTLARSKIKLMCYFPTHVLAKYPKATEEEFVRINTEVMTEFGERYGQNVVGYWFDGWYQCFAAYPGTSFEEFFRTCKVANPHRIVALNSWVYPAVTEWQEYWAGEVASPVVPPKGRYFDYGPAKGLQYQALVIMEPYWVQEKAEMPDPRFSAEELSGYILACMKQQGAVTINLGIYQDGTVGTKALQVMRDVRKRVRESSTEARP